MMLCGKCKHNNVVSAKYCAECGSEFTEQERQSAYDSTVYGKIEKFEKIKSFADFSVITGNVFFRILVLALLGFIMLFNIYANKNQFGLRDGDNYKLEYNKENDKFYLLTAEHEIAVSLYIPQAVEKLDISCTAPDGTSVYENTCLPTEEIVLPNAAALRYRLTETEGGQGTHTVIFYVCNE